jgi:hypothetical protein
MRVLLVLVLGLCASAAQAEVGVARQAECTLVVQGTEYLRGPCTFTPIDEDGSFTAAGPDGAYFAYVLVDGPGIASGYWNGTPFATKAHDPLGTLTRQDACWVNETAEVCAW